MMSPETPFTCWGRHYSTAFASTRPAEGSIQIATMAQLRVADYSAARQRYAGWIVEAPDVSRLVNWGLPL
jgi:hypothetical protein